MHVCPIFTRCDEYKWKFICRFKEGRIKSIASEFNTLKEMEPEKIDGGIVWVNSIPYNQRTVNLIETKLGQEDGTSKQYVFITNIKVTKKNARGLVAAGRSRWKIENQEFNQQKNIKFNIEHANSHDYTAMKNHYLLVQIADIIMQLYEKGPSVFKTMKKTAKEKSSNLLEAIRTRRLTDLIFSLI